jgi:hypothetical protein
MRRVSKMPGENNLSKLLANLSPALAEEEYVFCTFIDSSYGDFSELKPVASVMFLKRRKPKWLTLNSNQVFVVYL